MSDDSSCIKPTRPIPETECSPGVPDVAHLTVASEAGLQVGAVLTVVARVVAVLTLVLRRTSPKRPDRRLSGHRKFLTCFRCKNIETK